MSKLDMSATKKLAKKMWEYILEQDCEEMSAFTPKEKEQINNCFKLLKNKSEQSKGK